MRRLIPHSLNGRSGTEPLTGVSIADDPGPSRSRRESSVGANVTIRRHQEGVRETVKLDNGVDPNHGWRHTWKTRALAANGLGATAIAKELKVGRASVYRLLNGPSFSGPR